MLLAVFLTLVSMVFPAQLLLCFSGKRLPVKLLPLCAPLLCLCAAAVLVLLVGAGSRPQDDILLASVLVMVALYLFAAIAMAWIICTVVKLIQKRKK